MPSILTSVSRFLCTAMLVSCLYVGQSGQNCRAQSSAAEPEAKKADAKEFFEEKVKPFIRQYCLDCHQNSRPTEAGLSFTPALDTPGHPAFSEKWKQAAARVQAHDMPPDGVDAPTEDERAAFVLWLEKVKYLSAKDPGPFVIRRLSKTEYGNTLRDLFGMNRDVASSLPDEVMGEGYLNSLSPLQLEKYLAIADDVLDKAPSKRAEMPVELQELLYEVPGGNARATVARASRSVANIVYRRPVTNEEHQVLMAVYDMGQQEGLDHSDSVRLMVKAMLVSPQFLFITPASGLDEKDAIVPLDDYQLASRLSYLLWATMPDKRLIELADAGELHKTSVLQGQVKRMLADPRSRALFDGFGAQWLGLQDFESRAIDASKFPEMTSSLRKAMVDEVRLVFEEVVRENRSVLELIDRDSTFLNEDLAKIYKWKDEITGTELRRVSLSDPNRGGILGMPGVLTATSFPNRTSPVVRGVWVLEQLLGEQVPSAPPNVPELEEQEGDDFAGLTLRQRTEKHRKDPVCANCHKLLDPIGFGLENFDAIGRWRDQDENGQVIDATGELPDGSRFSSPQELKAMIVERGDDFARNFVEKLLAYALSRRLEGYDEIVVDRLMQDIAQDEFRMQTLISSVVNSYPFTHRRLD